MQALHPAFQKMLDFNKKFKDASPAYKTMQAWQLKNSKDCQGIFCPSSFLYNCSPRMMLAYAQGYTQLTDYHLMSKQTKNTIEWFWGVHLFGAWRNTLSIYQIDDDIVDSVIESTIPDDTPTSIFNTLPEWCVYFDLSNAKTKIILDTKHSDPTEILGFWALYDKYSRQPKALHIVPHLAGVSNSIYDTLQPLSLILDDNATVAKQAEQALKTMSEHADKNGKKMDSLLVLHNATADNKILIKLLSCLLWLCAETPDISNIVGEPLAKDRLRLPKYRQNKKTGAFIVPSAPTFYSIGKRLGGEIRTFNERINAGDDRISSRKRPHIRRGHWHGHWRGTGQAKEFFVKWQPAVFVNSGV